MSINPNLKKYQSLLVAISLFLVLFVAVLMASHLMQKSVTRANSYYSAVQDVIAQNTESVPIQALIAQLKTNEYKSVAGELLVLPSLKAPRLALLQDVTNSSLQGDLKKGLAALLQEASKELKRQQKLSASFMFLATVFAVILYIVVLVQLVRRLGEGDESSESSKKETANIMSTVSEGLFLLGRNYDIGVEQSKSLKKMFDTEKDLEGNFFDFIRQYVTEADVENARDYIEILFGERVKEKLIEQLNPLTEVRIHITRLDGSYESRYLRFKFNRVMDEGKLAYLLVSTTDISRQVQLEKELAETKERQDSQIDLLMSILHVNSKSLSAFFLSTEEALNKVNDILKEQGYNEYELHEKTEAICRHIHKVKGDSANLGLHKFEAISHAIEEEIEALRKNKKLSGSDLLEFTGQLKDMFSELENMKSLVNKVSGIRTEEGDDDSAMEATGELHGLVKQVSHRASKPVVFNSYGMSDQQLPDHLNSAVNDIATQLIRNSIVHGIESPEQREQAGKSAIAQVIASFKPLFDGGYELIVQDDGAGVNESNVIKRAVEQGLLKAGNINKIDSQMKIAKLLFAPGFSTQDEADLDAGRGVGLDLVRSISKEHSARISLRYQAGKYCRFRIVFPAVIQQKAA